MEIYLGGWWKKSLFGQIFFQLRCNICWCLIALFSTQAFRIVEDWPSKWEALDGLCFCSFSHAWKWFERSKETIGWTDAGMPFNIPCNWYGLLCFDLDVNSINRLVPCLRQKREHSAIGLNNVGRTKYWILCVYILSFVKREAPPWIWERKKSIFQVV